MAQARAAEVVVTDLDHGILVEALQHAHLGCLGEAECAIRRGLWSGSYV